MRFKKIYLEISNICNLHCSFCHGTKRAPKIMSRAELAEILPKLRGYTEYLYFHIMGEPLCHPDLEYFLALAGELGFRVIITTNGVLLNKKGELLLSSSSLHKVNISLHAFEANDLTIPFSEYLANCFEFGRTAAKTGEKIVVYRLWNNGGKDALNQKILDTMSLYFKSTDGEYDRRRGITLDKRIFLEYGDKFDWPDAAAEDMGEDVFCYGLRDQLGILCDGTVVPCCLDCEGDIALGNIFDGELEEIINSERARAIYDGFSQRRATEPLCRRCGYAKRFKV